MEAGTACGLTPQPGRAGAVVGRRPGESVWRASGPAELSFVKLDDFQKEAPSSGGYPGSVPGSDPNPSVRPLSHPGSLPQFPVRGQAWVGERGRPLPQTRYPTPALASRTPGGKPNPVETKTLVRQQFRHLARPPKELGQWKASWSRGDPPPEPASPQQGTTLPCPGEGTQQANLDPLPAARGSQGARTECQLREVDGFLEEGLGDGQACTSFQ